MTIAMPDSIYPRNLPPGYGAYLGYVDGSWPTAAVLREKFPRAHILMLTVKGGNAVADGSDCESGDLDPEQAAAYAKRRLDAGAWRPVTYASVSRMAEVLAWLAELKIGRADVRLLSAHYGKGQHICGPRTCKYPGLTETMDGTQWTNVFTGNGGAAIDMSSLADGFFGATAPGSTANWTEIDMSKLAVLKEGDTDHAGAFWSVRRLQSLLSLTGEVNGIAAAKVTVDGSFGSKTDAAVRAVQARYGIGADGVAGAHTWSVLLTGAP